MKPPIGTKRLEGSRIDGRFLIKKQLGKGGFGTVYLAEQQVFNVPLRPVALKLLHGTILTPENAAQLLKDAIMLIQLQQEATHAHMTRALVTIYDAGFLHDYPEQAFVAMEYVTGYPHPGGGTSHTLQDLIYYHRPTPIHLALYWMIQILRPLAWMHTLPRPVLHCDLKPDNILVAGENSFKIADFGLAQLVYNAVGTQAQAGALAYQAPETLAGTYPTLAADVYALGLIFYEILLGENPLTRTIIPAGHVDDQASQLQLQARVDGLPPLSAADHPDLKYHPLLQKIIERCLRLRASDRYPNAAALLQAVEKYAAGEGVEIIAESLPTATEPAQTLTLDRLLAEANIFIQQAQYDQAKKRCQETIQQFPDSGKPYRWLAQIYLAQGRWKDALKVCSQGRQIDPDEPDLFEAMAAAYEQGGNNPMADAMRKRALALQQKKAR